MTDKQQLDAFANDLDNLIERYRSEFELTYAVVVGVLQMKSHLMMVEACGEDEQDL